MLLTFFYKTTERIFTAKIDIQDIDLISYNLTFPGLLDDTSGIIGLNRSEVTYSLYKTLQSRQIPLINSRYDSTFNFNLFNYKGNKLYLYYYQKENEEDTTLIFESRFESGNLRRAVKIGDNEYNLILKYDHNTTAYTQWYYFRIENTRKN